MRLHRHPLRIFLLAFALLGIAAVASPVVHAAATFTIVNNDGAGEGFNDPTAAAPVGGNTGTTIGAQRLIAFQHAANIWGALLSSSVPIRVRAQFDALSCSATSAVLGSAGPVSGFRDFPGALVAGTFYPSPLANALNGGDLDAGSDDINATFNSTLGTTCAFPNGWYYGLDASPPGSQIDFVSVLLHELGHGLGFLTFVSLTTGAKPLGFDDSYMRHLENHGASPSDYPSMTDAQRVAASTATGNLHWVGPNVRAASGILSAGKVGDHVRMFAPNPQQSGSSVSHWDTVLTPNQVMEPSYTQPLHSPVLELPLFQDIGWTITPQNFTIAVSASPPAGGSVGGGGTFPSGSSQTVTATANSGYTFTSWTEGGSVVSTSASYNFTLTANRTLVANFTQQTFTIDVSASPPAGGSVGGGGTFPSGSSRTVTATANAGYVFANWTEGGSVVSTSASYTFTLTANRTLVANFTQQTFTIDVSASPPAGGSVGGGGTFPSGSSQTVTATANSGYTLTNWTEGGSVVSTSASYTFTLTANRTLVANFTQVFTIAVSASPASGGTASGGGTFATGSSRTVSATPNNGWAFASWTESGSVVSTSASYTFTLTGNRTLVANFIPKAVSDFNGDGKTDFLMRRDDGTIALFLMNGFQVLGAQIIGIVGNEWAVSGVGDFNGDGKADFLMRNTTDGSIGLFLMDGFQIVGFQIIGVVGIEWSIAGVGDFNGDSKADFLMRNATDGSIGLFLMNGFQIVGYQIIGTVAPDWSVAGVGDFNGDGKADFLTRHTDGSIALYLMDGFQNLGTQAIGVVGTEWSISGIGDFDGNGKADFMMRRTDGSIAIFLMDGFQVVGFQIIGVVGTEWSISGIGDFDGNGKADFMMRRTDGSIAIFLMDGFQVVGFQIIGIVGTEWQSCHGQPAC